MSGIFISYRRDDSSGWAGRLYEHLARDWGPERVFMDIDAIAPGEDFRAAITRTMDTCSVVMVVIGPHWIGAVDKQGNRRLDDPGDNHRQEVVAALAASDVRVVPVLVGGATMPTVGELPDALHDLAYRNAAVVDDRRFTSDVRALQASLRELNPDASESDATRASYSFTPAAPAQPAGATGSTGVHAAGTAGGGHDAAGGTRTLSAPVVLAISGALVAVVWGMFVPRDWHNEQWPLRVLSVLLLAVLVAVGLWQNNWSLVLAGGVAGFVGMALWVQQLVSDGHTFSEMFDSGEDGFQNTVMFVGAALVVVAGALGLRRRRT